MYNSLLVIGTKEDVDFKRERFDGDDLKVANSDAFRLKQADDLALFIKAYDRSASLYFRGRPSLIEILNRIGRDLDKL